MVSEVEGKTVTSVDLSETYLKGKAFQFKTDGLHIHCGEEHGIFDKDLVSIVGLSTEHKLAIDGISPVIPKISFILNKYIGGSADTGIT